MTPGNLDRRESNGPFRRHGEHERKEERKKGKERGGREGRFVVAIAHLSQDEADPQESEKAVTRSR